MCSIVYNLNLQFCEITNFTFRMNGPRYACILFILFKIILFIIVTPDAES